ncbi:MAG TPA: hypothetical protein VGB62_05715, partial [Allosphingosinicella sp.]
MYHAPVPMDIDPQDQETAELADQGVGADPSSQRLREAHLYNGQAQTRALFAPFFAVTAISAALLAAWAMFGNVPVYMIGGWVALVCVGYGAVYRVAVREGAAASSRSAEGRSVVHSVGEAVGLALLWSSLPIYAFATLSHGVQVVVGAAMGAMILGAIGL